ncbi:alpha-2-macroglobulin [soil metagenome]
MTSRARLVTALAVLIVVVVAAAGLWQRFHRSGSENSIAQIGAEQPFALVECKARLLDGSPAVAVMFTQPLDRSQSFGKLFAATVGDDKATVPSRWVLGDNPRVLYLPYVTPQRTYHVSIGDEVKAAGGQRIATATTCSVDTEAMPESFYFASKGVVLPAGQNGGLPIVTVNVPEVDVQFLRINGDSLPSFLERVAKIRRSYDEDDSDTDVDSRQSPLRLTGNVGGYELDELRGLATSVYAQRFTTDTRPDRRNTSFLPVEKVKELQEPGIYVAVMSQPGRFGWDFQVTYFYVTDVGLQVRRHADQLDVFTTSLKHGEAIGNVELSLLDLSGKTLAQARTDNDGHAVFQGKNEQVKTVLARRNRDLAVIAMAEPALDLSEYDVSGHPSRNRKLFVYAGRDLYRPGETFDVSILARDADGHADADAAPLTVTLKKPDGDAAFTQLVRPQSVGSAYYRQTLTLPVDAATGRWSFEVRSDPGAKRADTQWTFQVEEFLPERMKLDLKAPEKPLSGTAPLSIDVTGNYLYGAPAACNRLLGSVFISRQKFALPQALPGFVFGDIADDKASQRSDLEETELSSDGKATIDVPVDLSERRSPMQIRTALSLLETGGRPVVRSIERTWWPAPVLIGIRPLFDRDTAREGELAQFELVRVDGSGAFKPASDLQLKLIREDRRWYWRYDDNRGWTSGYDVDEDLSQAQTVDLSQRKTIGVPVDYGTYRLEIADPQTGQTARYRFYAGWSARDAEDLGNRPDRVALKLEGVPVDPATTKSVKLLITPPHDGEALVTIESDRVLYTKRVAVRTGGTRIDLPIDPAWQRHDLYVGVVAFRPGSAGSKVTPARALGRVHLPLARESRKLAVAISAPAKSEPERTVGIKLHIVDAAGKPLAAESKPIVTLSAVDEGILNITNFKTPDPFDFFFGKHRYDADILDMYGKLIEKMDGVTAKQRYGGDAGMRDSQSLPRKVKLIDLFSGPVALDANGDATIPVALPDFNGSLRLMAVASSDQSYGSADTTMIVAAPIVAELALPRFIAPGDQATLSLDLTNLSGASQEVKIAVDSGTALKVTGPAATLTLADKQRSILRYTAQASDSLGLAPIRITVTAAGRTLVRESLLQVQPATPTTREIRRLRIEPGAHADLDTAWADPLWPASAVLNVAISNKPPIDVKEQVKGLLEYPYGCLEQTTSSAYPWLYIDEAAAAAYGIKPVTREQRAARLAEAFGRLSAMQQPRNGFGLWSASSPYEAWLSAYVTGFLQDARDAGFAVPETLLSRALDGLGEQFQKAPSLQFKLPAQSRRNDTEPIRSAHQRFAESAYAGFVLAREQRAPLATLRTLHDDYRVNARSPLPLVHLGIALKLMGDEARSKVAIDEAMNRAYGINPNEQNRWWSEWLGDYGSRVRDTALAYALMQKFGIEHPRRETLLVDLMPAMDQRSYYSTQERIALLQASLAAGAASTDEWQASIKAGASRSLTSKTTRTESFDAATLKRGISVTNESQAPLFIEAALSGNPLKPLPPASETIAVQRSWYRSDGSPLTTRSLKTGDMLIVRVHVTSARRVRDGLIVDRVPAGVEIENLNLSQGVTGNEFTVDGINVGEALTDSRVTHTEYRDDRFVAAAEFGSKPLDLFYLVRVVTPGKFVVPSAYAEDMYRPELRGVGAAEADMTITDPRAAAGK